MQESKTSCADKVPTGLRGGFRTRRKTISGKSTLCVIELNELAKNSCECIRILYVCSSDEKEKKTLCLCSLNSVRN